MNIKQTQNNSNGNNGIDNGNSVNNVNNNNNNNFTGDNYGQIHIHQENTQSGDSSTTTAQKKSENARKTTRVLCGLSLLSGISVGIADLCNFIKAYTTILAIIIAIAFLLASFICVIDKKQFCNKTVILRYIMISIFTLSSLIIFAINFHNNSDFDFPFTFLRNIPNPQNGLRALGAGMSLIFPPITLMQAFFMTSKKQHFVIAGINNFFMGKQSLFFLVISILLVTGCVSRGWQLVLKLT